MRRLIFGLILFLVTASHCLAGNCPAVLTDCGNINAKNGAIGGTLTITGLSTFNGITAHTNRWSQIAPGTINLTANNGACTSGSQWWCTFVYASSSGVIAGDADVHSISISDNALTLGSNVVYGLNIEDNIAPNGTTSSGPRVALGVSLIDRPGGFITSAGIRSAAVFNVLGGANLGGTSSQYAGAYNSINPVCNLQNGATFIAGCSGTEIDLGAAAGSSYNTMVGLLITQFSNHAVKGLMHSNSAITITDQVNASVGLMYGISINSPAAQWSFDPYAHFIYAQHGTNTTDATNLLGSALDFGHITFKTFTTRMPFRQEVVLKAVSITGVTRLTSDGAAASSFVNEADITNLGSGYTSNPTVAVTGCTGAVVKLETAGGILGNVGVNTPGSACAAEATAAVSGGGGSAGAVRLGIAGNTLNFPINSAISVYCTVSATTLTHGGTDAAFWHIWFTATMGATASTTAIVGSPAWVTDPSTAGAAAKFSGSAPAVPTADTTLGAVNLSLTPTSGTWDVGGACTLTKTSQV